MTTASSWVRRIASRCCATTLTNGRPDVNGEYNFVTNPGGVLKYWEQRVRENGQYENIYTLGMRGISDSGMPGGGTPQEKADRLRAIISAQREMLARDVNPNVAAVPQIFCPYKEVLELYRLAPDIPGDITLVWPDDNYGYVREFSDARERARSGGAGVYYHVSYWGAPRDYLWLCSTPPALIAEEMTKAFDYGADKVWIVNVGDLKPAELDIEFFLKLAWNPHSWNGTNTYELAGTTVRAGFRPGQRAGTHCHHGRILPAEFSAQAGAHGLSDGRLFFRRRSRATAGGVAKIVRAR